MTNNDSSNTELAVEVRDLRKSYGEVEAVRGVSFEVARGEVFCLLGPNGAGKTTTVEILEGYRSRTAARRACWGWTRREASASCASASGSCSSSAASRAT